MTPEDKEVKLTRLRTLWKFAKSQGKEKWAKQIETDAERIKNKVEETEATYEQMQTLLGVK